MLMTLLKDKSEHFKFQLQIGSLQHHTYINNFTGEPSIPLLGKYSKNQYQFLEVASLVAIPLHQQNGVMYSQQDDRINAQQIHIPEEVLNLLNAIPDQILHNKKPKLPQKSKQSTKSNQKQQFDTSQVSKPDQIEFNPLHYEFTGQCEFIWTINVLKDHSIDLTKDTSLNYVTHNMIFEQFDFSKHKKMMEYLPLCLVRPHNIYEWQDVYNSLQFGQLRSEYLSTHLVGGSLCFSPNNMKVGVTPGSKFSSFWSVILRENQNHLIIHHWVVLDVELSHLAKQFAEEATTLQDLFNWFAGVDDIKNDLYSILCDSL